MEDKIGVILSNDGLFSSDKIIIDENNSNTIISAGSSGIHRSIDGGQNWSNPSQLQIMIFTSKAMMHRPFMP